jgi:glycosyltransferase involved in cell wall biosynthesis
MTCNSVDEPLRVVLLPDSFTEVDGVANTCRQFEAFARRRNLPFMVMYGFDGPGEVSISQERCAFPRGRVAFPIDKKHDIDVLFWRYMRRMEAIIRDFNPDIVHVTGPSDLGILGALMAQRLHVPLAASWHTNVHEYAEQRSRSLLSLLPPGIASSVGATIREATLSVALRFYRIAQILYAPNQDLIQIIEKGTRKPCFLMERGVDTFIFDPVRRDRTDDCFTVGFVGRMTVEKNVHMLADLERALIRAGLTNFRFLLAGQGAEEQWLRANLKHAEFAGVLTGADLGRAYANMDVFVFPSKTDTYGNVVLEALSAGVPAVVSDVGGPRFIVRQGETGFVAASLDEFVNRIMSLARNPGQLEVMRAAARQHALGTSWDRVFEYVYAGYERGLRSGIPSHKRVRVRRRAALSRAI